MIFLEIVSEGIGDMKKTHLDISKLLMEGQAVVTDLIVNRPWIRSF